MIGIWRESKLLGTFDRQIRGNPAPYEFVGADDRRGRRWWW